MQLDLAVLVVKLGFRALALSSTLASLLWTSRYKLSRDYKCGALAAANTCFVFKLANWSHLATTLGARTEGY